MSEVVNNTQNSQFEMRTSAGLAVADYRLNGSTVTIYHTEVPHILRGQGHGERLVRGCLEMARSNGLKVVPACWFVEQVMSSSSEFADLFADR